MEWADLDSFLFFLKDVPSARLFCRTHLRPRFAGGGYAASVASLTLGGRFHLPRDAKGIGDHNSEEEDAVARINVETEDHPRLRSSMPDLRKVFFSAGEQAAGEVRAQFSEHSAEDDQEGDHGDGDHEK